MGYTKESVEDLIGTLEAIQGAIEDVVQAAQEYIEGLSDEADEDDLGLLSQTLDETVDDLEGNGLQLSHLLKEGTDK